LRERRHRRCRDERGDKHDDLGHDVIPLVAPTICGLPPRSAVARLRPFARACAPRAHKAKRAGATSSAREGEIRWRSARAAQSNHGDRRRVSRPRTPTRCSRWRPQFSLLEMVSPTVTPERASPATSTPPLKGPCAQSPLARARSTATTSRGRRHERCGRCESLSRGIRSCVRYSVIRSQVYPAAIICVACGAVATDSARRIS
jgi:hypothetical protein